MITTKHENKHIKAAVWNLKKLPAVFDPIKGKSLARKRQISRHIPEVAACKTCLYIGAKPERIELVDMLYGMGLDIDVLEVFEPNVKALKELNKKWKIFRDIFQGDVRDLPEPLLGKGTWPDYDVIIFWHGPEHLNKEEIPGVLKELETGARCFVILGCPWGDFPQDTTDGNIHEAHLCSLTPGFFENLGYSCHTIKKIHKRGSNIVAWKRIGHEKK